MHEFAKNVFDVHAFDGNGQASSTPTRPNPYQWNVTGHDGTVRIVYKVFGNHVDGTYLAVDDSHAHMNMPATLMWARGFDMRPVRVTFRAARGLAWKPATQLFPTDRSLDVYRAEPAVPDGQSDGAQRLHAAIVHGQQSGRQGIHDSHGGPPRRRSDPAIDEYAAGAEKIVNEAAAVFGEFPAVRHRHLHVPRRLRAVGRRRRHGASQQHGRGVRDVVQESTGRARGARHRVARVLPLLERRADPPEDARAVQLRRGQHLR